MIPVSSVHHCILTHGKLHGTATMILASFYSTIIIPMYSRNLFHFILFYFYSIHSNRYFSIDTIVTSYFIENIKLHYSFIIMKLYYLSILRAMERIQSFNNIKILRGKIVPLINFIIINSMDQDQDNFHLG